ncbi:MAG: glycosyltransferase [Gammaproteobacteria bacterium]|nr:MAG: glycosyltransferase [Gammaproteobacteria bacterium]
MESESGLPLVSVAISCYNHGAYIRECILSVLNQTYPRTELIVIDDGSSDQSVEKIRELLDEGHHFTFLAQENAGLPSALNKALGLSSGKYFVPFGSDDVMLLDRIEKQVKYMDRSPHIVACGGNVLKIDQHGRFVEKQKMRRGGEVGFDDIFAGGMRGLPAPTMMILREALCSIGGFNQNIPLEDLYIQLSLARRSGRLGMLDDLLAYYRVHPTNTYKNINYMVDSVLDTYECFSDAPGYEKAKFSFLNSMLLRASKKNRKVAMSVLKKIPLKKLEGKGWRALMLIVLKTIVRS